MLTYLSIVNLGLIERIEIDLGPGLAVLTGETGAGKSMLVGAIQLALGGRADADLVRAEAEEAVVEAIFAPSPECAAALAPLLAEQGIDTGESLIVRRVVSRSGRNRQFVNGCAAKLATLRAVTRGLVDISGQHEHTSLTDAASYAGILDAYGGTSARAAALAAGVSRLRRLEREIADLAAKLGTRESRADFLRFQLAEIDDVRPEPAEDERLAAEATRLERADELRAACGAAAEALADGQDAVADSLAGIVARLASAGRIDPMIAAAAESVATARALVVEAAADLARRADSIEADPAELERIRERLDRLDRLERKHRTNLGSILALAEGLRAELASLEGAEDTLANTRREAAELARALFAEAVELARARQKGAKKLGKAVERELGALGMPGSRFEVALDYAVADGGRSPDPSRADPVSLGPGGLDHIDLLIAPNPGEGMGSLARTASGGELSRVLLALKAALVAADPVPTVLFDEIDAGVGGEIALAIGRKIKAVAADRQVLAITHLPQIAAFATDHLRVEKSTHAKRTTTTLARLDEAARVDELARMMGGVDVTTKTRAHAAEMLARSRT